MFAAPEAFSEAETELVALALSTPLVRDLRKHLDYWLDRFATDELAIPDATWSVTCGR